MSVSHSTSKLYIFKEFQNFAGVELKPQRERMLIAGFTYHPLMVHHVCSNSVNQPLNNTASQSVFFWNTSKVRTEYIINWASVLCFLCQPGGHLPATMSGIPCLFSKRFNKSSWRWEFLFSACFNQHTGCLSSDYWVFVLQTIRTTLQYCACTRLISAKIGSIFIVKLKCV